MVDDSVMERARGNVTGIVSTAVTAVWLAGLVTGQDWWLPALLVGYVAVVPLVAVLAGDDAARKRWWTDGEHRRDEQVDDDGETPLERLRDRYARGELTDEQFERKLERLLETETLEDVEDGRRARERAPERETERT
jgi:uncharacterized membrane protein